MKIPSETPRPRGRTRRLPVPPDPDDEAGILRFTVATRLDAAMQKQGINVPALALATGSRVSEAHIRSILRADQEAGLTVLMKLSAALHLTLDDLTGDVTKPRQRQATPIPIRGGARLGAWRSMALTDDPRGTAADVVPHDERYQQYPRYGIEIEDDQLMGLSPPVPRGAVAIYADLSRADVAIESGKIYLVHLRNTGGLIETAFRRATANRANDRYELAPLTADAARNKAETVTVTREELEGGDTVAIAGLLVATTVRYL